MQRWPRTVSCGCMTGRSVEGAGLYLINGFFGTGISGWARFLRPKMHPTDFHRLAFDTARTGGADSLRP